MWSALSCHGTSRCSSPAGRWASRHQPRNTVVLKQAEALRRRPAAHRTAGGLSWHSAWCGERCAGLCVSTAEAVSRRSKLACFRQQDPHRLDYRITGRKIVQASAGNLKRVQLELGGKGANIVFDDAPLDAAVGGSAVAIFRNQEPGLRRGVAAAAAAGRRSPTHSSISSLADAIDPRGESARSEYQEMGPLTSTGHRDRVLKYIEVAKEQGSRILTGGRPPDDPGARGGLLRNGSRHRVVTARPGDRVLPGRGLRWKPFVSVTTFKDEAESDRASPTPPEYRLGWRPVDSTRPAARPSRSLPPSTPAWCG